MKNSIYLHIENNDFIPIGLTFENITNIDSYENESIDEVYIQDLLDFYEEKNCLPVLSLIVKKLNSGGSIVIQSIDLKQLSIAIAFGEVDQQTAKSVLYPSKKSIHYINDILDMLQSLEMRIEIKKYINIFEYYIQATKP